MLLLVLGVLELQPRTNLKFEGLPDLLISLEEIAGVDFILDISKLA